MATSRSKPSAVMPTGRLSMTVSHLFRSLQLERVLPKVILPCDWASLTRIAAKSTTEQEMELVDNRIDLVV